MLGTRIEYVKCTKPHVCPNPCVSKASVWALTVCRRRHRPHAHARYYVRHCAKPKGRAALALAVRVGSIVEVSGARACWGGGRGWRGLRAAGSRGTVQARPHLEERECARETESCEAHLHTISSEHDRPTEITHTRITICACAGGGGARHCAHRGAPRLQRHRREWHLCAGWLFGGLWGFGAGGLVGWLADCLAG